MQKGRKSHAHENLDGETRCKHDMGTREVAGREFLNHVFKGNEELRELIPDRIASAPRCSKMLPCFLKIHHVVSGSAAEMSVYGHWSISSLDPDLWGVGLCLQQHSTDDLLCGSHNSRDMLTTFKMMGIDFYL